MKVKSPQGAVLSLSQAESLSLKVMEYCDQLAQYTQTLGIVDRRYLTPEHRETNDSLARWASESGLLHWEDGAGNQWVRLESDTPDAKRLIMGSHTDTVPDGGRYDGLLGVVTPLVLLKHFAENSVRFDFHLDVVGFGDEEGTRFGCTLLGSSAISGLWESRWRELRDEDGVSMAQALYDFGLDVSKISEVQIESSQVLAYLETHIEQGPVLEERGQPLAAVKGIAGARRFDITIEGSAGHAGTVPMALRSDPLVLAGDWVGEVYRRALATTEDENPVVATVGRLGVFPGAVNVVPGKVSLSLDIRSLCDAARDSLLDELQEYLEDKVSAAGLKLSWKQTHNAGAVSCTPELTEKLTGIVESHFGESSTLVSGAGHDAMALAKRVPTSMLFVRCKGGISHHPDESVESSDVAAALRVLAEFISAFEPESRS